MGLMFGAILTGCDSAPLSSEADGEVWVGVRGDEASETGPSQALLPGEGESGSASAEGSVAVRARVYLWSDAGEWVEVTRGAASQTMRVDGSDGVQAFARSEVAAGTYSRVRVEFEQVLASASELHIGLSAGEAELGVELGGDERVVVEREVALRVESGAEARLTMNLNADAWLAQADTETGAVAETAFAGAIEIFAK